MFYIIDRKHAEFLEERIEGTNKVNKLKREREKMTARKNDQRELTYKEGHKVKCGKR